MYLTSDMKQDEILIYMSQESVLSSGSLCLAPLPLTRPVLDASVAEVFRVVDAPGLHSLGRRIPSAPEISLDALETSAGGRPGRVSSTGAVCHKQIQA